MNDEDYRYLAVRSGDARFDGMFYVGVTSTGIYCRPTCPATTPKRENIRFFRSAAAAQGAGFRACKRCRPDAAPGSPEWNARADAVGRAMRLIADGAVDRAGVSGLAASLGYSERHLNRLLITELGAGPLALARAQRAQTARILVETTTLPMGDIAFAAGFSSIRQFNETMRAVFARSPTGMRERSEHRDNAVPAGVTAVRLPFRAPCDLDRLFGFLAERAVPGVEELSHGVYRRVLRLPHGRGIAEISTGAGNGPGKGGAYNAANGNGTGNGHIQCRLHLDDLRDLGTAVQRCRRLLDLDTDPHAVAEVLAQSDLLGPAVAAAPGLRAPGHVDPAELAVRAIVGQQVSVAAARTVAGRIVEQYGKPLTAPNGGLTHVFPEPEDLAAANPEDLPMPAARARALQGLMAALASGEVDLGPGADRADAEARLRSLPGVGPWTAGYIRMRALGDPDVLLESDHGVQRALRYAGHAGPIGDVARTWRPWRSYATHHLWAMLAPAPEPGSPKQRPR
ncbi:AraC family transcriptional regulator of adaptative response / DNA-3-methyladenine glycosylase II [Lipingzhangella halophila]|uniref:DNA-3-methyladenine glycosylase II n=1 Tax=Lipingzhangella halophila TaxID=1783352 RepID=A0A7W7RL48_9ACTN|nr:AlkA N-terminal domain-containing protein [Lipingzhangella halophila]MBB4934000.1 AraC family transcriptional regulator of adaptative response / DNA-3-methyladenine glycosylase II [Lipingzhangella halophila]